MKTFEPNKTIKELGIDTTRKFIVVAWYGNFDEGEVLELSRDNGSPAPYFKNKYGKELCVRLARLAYYEEEMKEGDLCYVSDRSEEHALKSKKERILLRKCNDGYVCISCRDKKKYEQGKAFDALAWNYAVPAVPIPKKETLEVTMQEIADKFEVDIENLKIKK